MAIVIVDGQKVELTDHERLNGIQAAQRAGVEIPHYCWHAGLTVVASCRMCLVETGTRNAETGEISMMPKLVPACQTPAKDNTVFVTNSEKVQQARAMVEEDLLIDHPIDCPICDKAGECNLQDYHFKYGQESRRTDIRPFTSRRRPMGDTVTLFVDRCVMCTRCVRFTREISGDAELMVINRGSHEEIDVFPGFPLDNKMSGNVVDLCPVGALGDKDFLYQQRVWFMQKQDHVCAGCSTGCSITVDQNQDHIYRLRPRENQHINQWWMCDEGRYGYHHVHDEKRHDEQRMRDGDQLVTKEWTPLATALDERLRRTKRLAAVLSPHLTVEDAYLLAKYFRQLDSQARLYLGPVPVEGTDEKFKNGFTIRAEKCPNRRGIEALLTHFTGKVPTFEDFLGDAAAGNIEGAWVTGGYKSPWHTAEAAESVSTLKLLIVQDMFDSPLWQQADFQLPGAAFAEREGSFVNFNNRLQAFTWAVRPPTGVRTEARLAWQLLKTPGMYNARAVLSEIAAEIAFFASAGNDVPPTGIDLKVHQLANS